MPNRPIDAGKLRHAAEARLAIKKDMEGSHDQARLVHELQVHQIEMEMQSEALQQAHAALEVSHDRYLDLYELSPVGFLTLTTEEEIVEINLTGAMLFGFEQSKLIARKFSPLLHPEDIERWQQFFQQIIKQGGNQNAEFRLAGDAANTVYVRLDCQLVRRISDQIVLHVAITDISATKQAENQLREQDELFRLIAERLDGYIAVLDIEGRRVYNSPSYQGLLGKRDISGTDSFMEVHPDDREQVIQAFRETVESGIGQHLEYRFVLPDCSIRTMESRGGVARDSDGRIKYVVVVSHDITQRKLNEQKIHHLAFYDALTQLPNRLTLNDRLQQAMAASKRSGHYGALMFLDLDHFKPLNDAYGHRMGDQLLIQAARRITDCVRGIDTVARFGGDEFVVVLGELDVDLAKSVSDTLIIADKIRAAIAEPYHLASTAAKNATPCITHRCTASIGVVLFLNHEQSEEEVLKLADIAMYRAKAAGRDTIYFYGAEEQMHD
jgi:diguanylate cyclase (GGDEF)-like protein/PAS domain S-box-containing protein